MAAVSNSRLGGDQTADFGIASTAVPVCLAPNGTVATNGTVTLGTALSTTYAGGIWLRLPANAVVGGAAGLYWAVMSSTTVGQVYTNFQDPANEFVPFIPGGTLVAATGSNGAYTQTTGADITLANITIPAGILGLNGQLVFNRAFSYNTAAGTKLFKILLGGVSLQTSTRTTTGGGDSMTMRVRVRGAANRTHVTDLSESSSTATTNSNMSTIDTATQLSLALVANNDTATNWMVYEGMSVEAVL